MHNATEGRRAGRFVGQHDDLESWGALIGSFASVRRHLRDLPTGAFGALAAFEAAAFGARDPQDSARPIGSSEATIS